MAESPLLSDRCTICHSPPKYRCPRCSARTCSLACSQRHKQWAQCSGVRNPAAYLKRHELATPTNFDRDYNFISGIERGIETAERAVTARGVRLQETTPASKRDGPLKGEVNLRQALEKSGVVVERAPAGMKRSLQNKTSWNKNQRCISWTVEWITNDNTTHLGTSPETLTPSQAFARHTGEAPPTKKRKLSQKQKKKEPSATALVPKPDMDEPSPPQLPPPTGSPPPSASPTSPPAPHPPSFYLHIPNPPTPSSNPTLLPLSPAQPLSTLLRGRLVREFPTIYVLNLSTEGLPREKYTLQRDVAGEVAAELGRILDGGEAEAEVDADDTKEGHGKEGDADGRDHDSAHGRDHDSAHGSSIAGNAPPGRDGTGNKVGEKRVGSLATGTDELSWIMRAVI
ncbi:hypothetical protein MMC27_002761 [Xylographa pallens]|nr:hypothetical protein [Xylographa pallens]